MKNNIAIIFLMVLICLCGCQKDTVFEQQQPKITNLSVNPYGTSASFYANVCYPGNKTVIVELCDNAEMDSLRIIEMVENDNNYSISVDNLDYNTNYYWRVKVYNSYFSKSTETMNFCTLGLPIVNTIEVVGITSNSAVCKCEIVNDGGSDVIERGICWGTESNPIISDNRIDDYYSGVGEYVINVHDLRYNTLYFVRAFATNSEGICYGNQISFKTESVPIGAIDGIFTINDEGTRVYFSKGNLQYRASSNTWKFSNNQCDFIGDDNANMSHDYDGWIDLFGWGTSGYPHGAILYHPYNWNSNYQNYYAYGESNYNLFDQTGQADWGYNKISNGGNQENCGWRTLKKDEWKYVFTNRQTTSEIRYVKAVVNNVNGVVLVPDNWNSYYYHFQEANNENASYDSNIITASDWLNLEVMGAVFLPAAGSRVELSVSNAGMAGLYWSSSYFYTTNSFNVAFTGSNSCFDNDNRRNYGCSVRLVIDYQP